MNEVRFAELLERYFERELAADEKAELEALLLANAEARAGFWKETEWRARLHQWGQEQAGREAASNPLVPFPRPMLRRVLAWAAAVLLCAAGVWAWQRNQPVARVGELAGATWNHAHGDALRRGPVRLASGVAELLFLNGVRVVLEGPAELKITGGNDLGLVRGKLRASVPPAAHGFTVRGAGFTVVDHGTEFGVIAGDAPEVHVFEGKVSVCGASERLLAKAEAVRFSAGKMDAIVAQPSLFPGGARLAAAALAAHPSALVHLDFDGPLANRVAGGITAIASGSQPAEGRWPGEGALAFSNADDRVRLTVPGELRALTLLAWVRVEDNAQTQSALMMSGAELPGDVHWFLHRDNTLGFSVSGEDGKWHGGARRLPKARDWLGKWVFLATTFDGSTVAHYFDGRLIGTQRLDGIGPLRPGAVELGNWAVRPGDPLRASRNVLKEPAGYARNLHGSLDEFTLLSTALAADEIQRLYEQGRADSAPPRTFSK